MQKNVKAVVTGKVASGDYTFLVKQTQPSSQHRVDP
jgi:hypothetical protein